ncbi:PGR3 [Symbiodinium sp. CCMP2592]|nr:PGR3 [Symbiodinium sp. CCMP2592]
MEDLMEQVQALLISFSGELLLFGGAFLLQFFLFGNVLWPWRKHGKRKAGKTKEDGTNGTKLNHSRLVEATTEAYEQGDHRTVLRKWGLLQRTGEVPATTLVQVVESMQRLRKDRSFILQEVKGLVLKSEASQNVDFMNELLMPMMKSLDAGLVNQLLSVFARVGVNPDSRTYEILMNLHFATRSFDEVRDLASKMRREGLKPTQRSTLVLLKTALQEGTLRCRGCIGDHLPLHVSSSMSDALECYIQVPPDTLPKHVGTQLVETACRERNVAEVMPHLESGRIPLTVDSLNLLLNESLRIEDSKLAKQALRLASSQGLEKNGRTYSLLIRAAGGDTQEIRRILEELSSMDNVVAQAVLDTCAKTGDVGLAETLAKRLNPAEASQAPSFMSLIRFYAEAGEPARACDVYGGLMQKGADGQPHRPTIDARTKHCLLAAAQSCERQDLLDELVEAADASQGTVFPRSKDGKSGSIDGVLSMLEGPTKLPSTAWNIALDTCVENGELEKAKHLAKRMKEAGVIDVVSYNTLLKAYVRHSLFDQACSLLMSMRQDEVHRPNAVTYHELISGLLKANKEIHRTRAWELVSEMQADQVVPNKLLVANLLRSLRPKSYGSEVTRAMQLVDAVQHQVDEGLLCTVLEAGVRVGKVQVVQKKLKTFYGEGAEFPVKVTGAHSFGSLIKAYGFVKDVAGAWACWREMSMLRIQPTNITLGCMVEAVASNGDVDGAHELVQRLLEDPETKSQVNAVIYGSILKGFSRKKRMDRVWDAFNEMQAYGITPTLMSFNAILDGCVRNDEVDKIGGLLTTMQQYGFKPNLITYSTLIKGYCAAGDMQSAFEVFRELRSGSEAPDEVVYNTLLDGCLQAGLADEGENLVETMMDQGLAPSVYTLSSLVKILAGAKRLDRAFKVCEHASSRFRFRLNAQLQTALLQACITCKAYDRGARFYLKTHKDRLSADKKICQSLIRGLVYTGKVELAADLLRAMLGISGASEAASQHRASQDFDQALCVEVLKALADAKGYHSGHAMSLFQDLKAVKPDLELDYDLQLRMESRGTKISKPYR